ncbi:MAG: hypothetical protein OQK51_19520 [Kangiellaceae bacterium]|nr:hypothetical protein [Kangiellaceae bacterium]
MKRLCPSCRTKSLERRFFNLVTHLRCINCDKNFEDSVTSRLANSLNLFILLVLPNILKIGDYEIIIVLIFILNAYLILQYLPVTPTRSDEFPGVPPTNVKFEITDDVNENIRRYKEAQRNALTEKYNK